MIHHYLHRRRHHLACALIATSDGRHESAAYHDLRARACVRAVAADVASMVASAALGAVMVAMLWGAV